MPSDDPKWRKFRDELQATARSGDREWLDVDEVKAVLADAWRKGLPTDLVLACRDATSSAEEFSRSLDRLVRDTKVRVLVIDDEVAFANLLRLNLEKTGHYEVRTLSVPTEWERVIHDFRPHLLILDMIMPGLDGRELLDRLRADERTETLPVIVLTAILQNTSADAVNRQGVLHLAKPVSLKALLHCIEEHLAAAGIR